MTRDLDQTNPNQLTEAEYYQDAQELETAVNAIYSNFAVTGMYKRRKFFIYDALSGSVACTAACEGWIPRLINWANDNAGNSGVDLHWNALYQGVKRANLVIEKAPNVPESAISTEQRNRLLAQARFLRAFHYYKLISLWGQDGGPGVPLLETVPDEPGGVPRAPTSDVYGLIQSDLEFAISNLPASWSGADVGRATSVAAKALMARMQLDRGNYGAAQTTLQDIVNNGQAPGGGDLQLVDYFDNYREESENNAESIFEVQFSESSGGSNWAAQGGDGSNHTFRNQEYGFLQWRNVIASQATLDEMGVTGTTKYADVKDTRATSTFYFPCDTFNGGSEVYVHASVDSTDCGMAIPATSSGDDVPSWKKYQVYYRERRTGFVANSGINWREIRYAEVLLSLAETHLYGSSTNMSEAVDLMNQVRTAHTDLDGYNTANGPSINSMSEAQDALFHEVVMEFTGDPALLHFQLRHPTYLTQLNSNAFEPYVLPIPQTEIDNNPEISSDDQNPGY
jgi:hypothetical protein